MILIIVCKVISSTGIISSSVLEKFKLYPIGDFSVYFIFKRLLGVLNLLVNVIVIFHFSISIFRATAFCFGGNICKVS